MSRPPAPRYIFQVRLTPKASRNAIVGWVNDINNLPVLKVMVTTVPEKGKANEALIALLAKAWGIAKSHFIIEKGETDRDKTLSVPQSDMPLIPQPDSLNNTH